MKKMNLNDQIPDFDIWECDGKKIILINEDATFQDIIDRLEIDIHDRKAHRLIGEGPLDGRVYMINNYGDGQIYENGWTGGYA